MDEPLHFPDDLDQPLPPESQILLDQFKAYAVWHPRLLQVQTQLLHTIWEPAEVAFVVVCGPSGVGKSRLAEVLARRLNTPKPGSNGEARKRALLINTRPPDGALFHRTNYYQKGLALLGKTTFDRHIKVDIETWESSGEKKRPKSKTTDYQDHPEVRDAYEEELRRLALRVVILDEAQHLIVTSDGKQPKDQLNWIKSMTTETGVLHLLIGTYGLLPFCNLDGQMARRGLELHFSRYHIEDESDCLAFCNACSSLFKQIPLVVDHDTLMQRWWYFFEGSDGCIGVLKQWFVRALYLALREGTGTLTLTHLEQCILSGAKRARMNADARSGEAEFQYANASSEPLLGLNGLPAASTLEHDHAPAPSTLTIDHSNGTKQNPRVGERPPQRGEIGEVQVGKKSTNCSFSGSIDLDALRLVQSQVEVVQCPTCGSVSKAKVKGQSVLIASHHPRTARAVRNVPRWMQQGVEWLLVQKKE